MDNISRHIDIQYVCLFCEEMTSDWDKAIEHVKTHSISKRHYREGHSIEIESEKIESADKAKSDKLEYDLCSIPLEGLERLGRVFKEGERSKKYGKDNWLKGVGDKEYQLERANHALKHLLEYIRMLRYGYKNTEDDLAKVSWFCMTQMELERLERLEGR